MDISTIPHREYRDRLFKAIFGRNTEESKKWRLELYNALNGSNYTDPDDLEVNTIENVIYLTMRNDVSFLVDSQMTLYEQQSTYNPNLPLRGLMYFSQLYQMHLSRLGKTLHRSTLVKIPNPKFVVFYNGEKETPDRLDLKLSDAFEIPDTSGNFEWTAELINISQNHNISLQKKCEPLYNYIQYISRISENKKKGMSAVNAVDEAMDWAVHANLLNGFFKVQKEEVLAMSLTEYDEEEVRRDFIEEGREMGIAEGREIGHEEGAQQKALEAATELLKEGDSPEKIARCIGLPLEKVKELALKVTTV
nr:hypothetical protein [uncultured Treponema sp.]